MTINDSNRAGSTAEGEVSATHARGKKKYLPPAVLSVEDLEASAALCNPNNLNGQPFGKTYPSIKCTVRWGS